MIDAIENKFAAVWQKLEEESTNETPPPDFTSLVNQIGEMTPVLFATNKACQERMQQIAHATLCLEEKLYDVFEMLFEKHNVNKDTSLRDVCVDYLDKDDKDCSIRDLSKGEQLANSNRKRTFKQLLAGCVYDLCYVQIATKIRISGDVGIAEIPLRELCEIINAIDELGTRFSVRKHINEEVIIIVIKV